MAENFPLITYFIVIISIILYISPLKPNFLPPKLQNLPIANTLRNDPEAIKLASSDYGNIVQEIPAAVLYPSSINDIASLIKFANNNSSPFSVTATGQGHSVRGQAMARDGVVVNMRALENRINGSSGIIVSRSPSLGFYADVGGEQLWGDVLHATLEHGLSPVSWTDYLYLTVGGTLSNAGISGQTFCFGPQISNVFEMDVITGTGDFVTCSPKKNMNLFYAVLGGLGQFGIITRARIPLEPAPKRVKWVRMLYNDFSAFARDQERLISINGRKQNNALNYLEGLLLMNQGSLGSPIDCRLSFFPSKDHSRIISIIKKYGIIYCLEVAKYYDDHDHTLESVEEELQVLFKGLSFITGYTFEKDVSYVDFINRTGRSMEDEQPKHSHPWLNLFVPKSNISDFNSGVFKDIVLKRNITTGLVLFYPMNRNKWDDRMSAVIPDDEDVFYTIGFLHSSGLDEWEAFDVQNKDILQFCYNAGIEVKQYLPNYNTKEEWAKNHFGMKWTTFQERKHLFDPKMILSPGHSDRVRQRASPRHGLINYRIVVSITVKLFFSES